MNAHYRLNCAIERTKKACQYLATTDMLSSAIVCIDDAISLLEKEKEIILCDIAERQVKTH